jgi:hypothetical protein
MYRIAVWVSFIMAEVAALAYVLMGMGTLTVGSLGDDAMPSFYYIIPAVYAVMGILIISRWRWIRVVSAIIVTFTIVVFYVMYADQPDVMLSAPGLITKIAQAIMLAGLIYLLVKTKPVKKEPEAK